MYQSDMPFKNGPIKWIHGHQEDAIINFIITLFLEEIQSSSFHKRML